MKLKSWVKSIGGPSKAARLLEVSERSLFQWLASDYVPRPASIKKIQKISEGKVQANDLIDAYISRGKQ